MARRLRNVEDDPALSQEEAQTVELQKGFYITNGFGELKCKTVRHKANGGEAHEEQVPIRLRTINAAKDFALCIDGSAILAVPADGFVWGGT